MEEKHLVGSWRSRGIEREKEGERERMREKGKKRE